MNHAHDSDGPRTGRSASDGPAGGSAWTAVDHRTDYLALARSLQQIGSLNTQTVDDAEALARELERLRDSIEGYRDEEVDAESVRPPE